MLGFGRRNNARNAKTSCAPREWLRRGNRQFRPKIKTADKPLAAA
jgi:hypothetical protein